MHSNKNIPTFQDVVFFPYNSLKYHNAHEGGKLWRAKTKQNLQSLGQVSYV